MAVHLLPLGIAADKSESRFSHFLNASSVVPWAVARLEPPAVLTHLLPSDWQRGSLPALRLRLSPARAAHLSPSLSIRFLTTPLVRSALKLSNGNSLRVCSLFRFPFCLLQAILPLKRRFTSFYVAFGRCWLKAKRRVFTCASGEFRSKTGKLLGATPAASTSPAQCWRGRRKPQPKLRSWHRAGSRGSSSAWLRPCLAWSCPSSCSPPRLL